LERMMEQNHPSHEQHKDEMRKQIAAGVASLRAGKAVDGEAFFAAMEAEFDALEGEALHPIAGRTASDS